MDVQKYEIYFECWPGYLTSEQNERGRYLVQHEKYWFHISKHPCIVLFKILYKKIVPLPHKNRAVYSNAFHDIIDTWYNYHE